MKVYIFCDIEGISGIYTREQVTPDGGRHDEGRKFMTADINACAEGLKAGGADEVIVRDGHGGSYSVLWDQLSDAVDAIFCGDGTPDRYPMLEDADAIVLLGYHAMAGTQGAILEHSYNSKRVQNYWVNGEKMGELGIDANIAGEHRVPVIMVSGDDKLEEEVKATIPWAEYARVKKAMNTFGGLLLPPKKAHDLIYETARKAVEGFKNQKMELTTVTVPVVIRTEVMERCQLPNPRISGNIRIINGRTYEVTGDTLEDAFSRV